MYIRILDTDDWVVEYDAENNQYRVGYFQDNHFVDEVLFDAYKEEEQYKVDGRMSKNECLECDCYDEDVGCTMPSVDKCYACPLYECEDELKEIFEGVEAGEKE